MTIQTFQLGQKQSNQRAWIAACLGALIVFSSPFALRFSIEGKGYSLMVMLIAAGLLCRQNFLTSKEMSIQKNLLNGNVYISCLRIINTLLRTIHMHEYCADRLYQNLYA